MSVPFVQVLGKDQEVVAERIHQRAERLLQPDDHRVRIRRVDPVDHRFVRSGARVQRKDHLVDRVLDVGGAERMSVVPLDALVQLERVGEAVVGDRPGLREIGHRLEAAVEPDQHAEHVARDDLLDEVRARRSVERPGIAGDADHHRIAVARFRVRRGGRGRGNERHAEQRGSSGCGESVDRCGHAFLLYRFVAGHCRGRHRASQSPVMHGGNLCGTMAGMKRFPHRARRAFPCAC